ncbi:hypothetical protein BSG1_17770, partial [Bacillus sp. SG-1]
MHGGLMLGCLCLFVQGSELPRVDTMARYIIWVLCGEGFPSQEERGT